MLEHVKIFLHGLIAFVVIAMAVLGAVAYWKIVVSTVLAVLLLIAIYMLGRLLCGKPEANK